MKRSIYGAVLAVGFLGLGCAQESFGPTGLGPTGSVSFTVSGDAREINGGFVLEVGAAELYRVNGYNSGGNPISGRFDLSGTYAVTALPAESLYAPTTSNLDWLLDNRVGFYYTAAGGTAVWYDCRYADVQFGADGHVNAEFHCIDGSRIDYANQMILPGQDLIVTAQGQGMGLCRAPGDPLCAMLSGVPSPGTP